MDARLGGQWPRVSLLAVLCSLASLTPAAAQEVYKHVDANGSISFSNAPTDPDYQLEFKGSAGLPSSFVVPAPEPSNDPGSDLGGAAAADTPVGMDTEVTVYENDASGRLSGVTRNGVRTTNEYDDRNNLVSKRRSDGTTTTYDVGANNQLRGTKVTRGR